MDDFDETMKDIKENLIARIKRQEQEIERLNNIIKEAIEYIENNTLYSEDYDYDDEDNLQFQGAYDYKAREDLKEILKGSDKE